MTTHPRYWDRHGHPWEDSDKILHIVADWIDTAARTAVTDIDDLIWELKQAGYTLPDPTEHPKEN